MRICLRWMQDETTDGWGRSQQPRCITAGEGVCTANDVMNCRHGQRKRTAFCRQKPASVCNITMVGFESGDVVVIDVAPLVHLAAAFCMTSSVHLSHYGFYPTEHLAYSHGIRYLKRGLYKRTKSNKENRWSIAFKRLSRGLSPPDIREQLVFLNGTIS
ncbi:hypothetical protein TNCV_919111 [Trichonephila clavipes]|nr:hypothetical protein TNCV_919111 [Trichonephila clavipes]